MSKALDELIIWELAREIFVKLCANRDNRYTTNQLVKHSYEMALTFTIPSEKALML